MLAEAEEPPLALVLLADEVFMDVAILGQRTPREEAKFISFGKRKYLRLFEENPSGIFIIDCRWGKWALGRFGLLREAVEAARGATNAG